MRSPRRNDIKMHCGIGMIELMISIALSAFIMLGILQILQSTKSNNRVQDELSRLQERGRFAAQVLSRDIRAAAYYGCLGDADNMVNNLDSTDPSYTADLYDFTNGVTGTEGGGSTPDSLILRGAYGGGLEVEAPYMVQSSANIKVSTNTVLTAGDIVMVCDFSGGDIFQITSGTPTNGTVVHNTGAAVSPGNFNASDPSCPGANAHCLSKVYADDAFIFQVQSISYSIGTGASGQSALFRNGVELADGVENLQILYGEDQDFNKTADRYVVAGTAGLNFANVVAIRFQLLLFTPADYMSTEHQTYKFNGANITATDNRIRRVFSGTVTIRNRAG